MELVFTGCYITYLLNNRNDELSLAHQIMTKLNTGTGYMYDIHCYNVIPSIDKMYDTL